MGDTTSTGGGDSPSASSLIPYFSVIVPCFNAASTLARCIESVLAQSFTDWEMVIVDDGSTDDSVRVAASFQDERIWVVRGAHAGPGPARNTGATQSRGRYVAFLDADDEFAPEKLDSVRRALEQDPDIVVYHPVRIDRGTSRYWLRPSRAIGADEDMGEYLFVANQWVPTISIVLRRERAEATHWSELIRWGTDTDYAMRLYSEGARFRMLSAALATWHDETDAGRGSRGGNVHQVEQWLRQNESLLTSRARCAYRASHLWAHRASRHPVAAAGDFVRARRHAKMPWKMLLRQALRAYLPARVYRALFTLLVRLRGMPRSG